MKNFLLAILTFLIIPMAVKAGNEKDCAAAQDSAKARIARNEYSFYAFSRKSPRVMYFHKIDFKHYERTLTNKMKKDTSAQFIACYNKAVKPVLDSVFKCDFFNRVDSITAVYDDKGMGYRPSEFRGGQDSLTAWLNKNVQLPTGSAPDDGDSQIKVYYFIDISESGQVGSIKYANKTNCKPCEPVVTQALKKLPSFVPATQGGVPTKSTYILNFSWKP